MADNEANKKSKWLKKFTSMSTAIMLATGGFVAVDGVFNVEVAEAATQYTVNTKTLNVRAGAGTKYKVLGSVKQGQKLDVQSTSGSWYKIKFNGKTGYVSKQYVKAANVSSSSSNKETKVDTSKDYVVNTSSLNVRSTNSTSGSILGSVKKGTKLTVQSQMSNGWYKISYSGKTGYVSNSYVKVQNKTNSQSTNNSTTSSTKSVDTSKLNNTIAKYSGVSVYYKNLKTGYVYTNNASKSYFAASVIKEPYVLYVYTLAEKGTANLNRVYTYKKGMYRGGTGKIKNMPYGTKFTEGQLLEYAIRYSDNIAFRMLIDQYGTEGFKAYLRTNGIDSSNIGTVTGAYITANQAGQFTNLVYSYIQNPKNKYASKFKKDLMNTSNPMIKANYPIARKYGWAGASFHDAAIVYAPSPYILVILSNHDKGTSADFNMFSDISKVVQSFNDSN